MKKFKKLALVVLALAGAFITAALAADAYVAWAGKNGICDNINQLPPAQAVMVLGAAVYRDGQMSPAFSDRAQRALEVYRGQKARKILISGDHRQGDYDEVDAAKKFFTKSGVPGEDIFVDYQGFDTYASVSRAKNVFKVETMIISTQEFHLPRALYLARRAGIDATGIKADLSGYNLDLKSSLRENAARAKAFWDVMAGSKPGFSGNQIPINGDGRNSWDVNKF